MSRRTALREVQYLAEGQYGLATTGQLRARGVARWDVDRLVGDGVLEAQESHGVYRLVGCGGPLWLPVLAAWLTLRPDVPGWDRVRDPDAVASHATAADVLGIGDLLPTRHEFLVRQRRQTRRTDLRLHVRRHELVRHDWQLVGGVLPSTTARRTIDDLLARQVDGSAVAGLGQSALQQQLISETDVAEMAERHADRYGYEPQNLAALLHGDLFSSIG